MNFEKFQIFKMVQLIKIVETNYILRSILFNVKLVNPWHFILPDVSQENLPNNL